jgi:hypothetical protein
VASVSAATAGPALDQRARVAYQQRIRDLQEEIDEDTGACRQEESAARFINETALGPGSWKMIPEQSRRTFGANAPMFVDMIADPRWAEVPLRAAAPTLLTDGEASPGWLPAIVDALGAVPHRHSPHLCGHGTRPPPHPPGGARRRDHRLPGEFA